VLVVNSGSSSVKFQLFAFPAAGTAPEGDRRPPAGPSGPLPEAPPSRPPREAAGVILASGAIDKIGMEAAVLRYQAHGGQPVVKAREAHDHARAIEIALSALTNREWGGAAIADPGEIAAVGHRVVHGGDQFTRSVVIDDGVLEGIRGCVDLAPLHNPHNIRGILACSRLLPGAVQVAVFDTAFHQTMPKTSYLYALPAVLHARYRVRRYGFHGTSHLYVHGQAIGRSRHRGRGDLKVVTAHLGNGCSLAAIDSGRSVDTSMGMTPLEGLVMGTRCGDVDAQAILHVMEKEELTLAQASTMMNKHSGLAGISGVSSDMRDLLKAAGEGEERARLAIEMFCYRLRKYIGSYAAALGGLDILVFTGGIGTFAPAIRERAVSGLAFAGVELDLAANAGATAGDRETTISTAGSRVEVMVIPTNEELVIARDTLRLLREHQDRDQGG
jgi:acetate kinase